MAIIKDSKNNKQMVKQFKGRDIVFGTAMEFLNLAKYPGQVKDNFNNGFLSFYCESKEDTEYVRSIISKHLLISETYLTEKGLPVYVSIDTNSYSGYNIKLDEELKTPFCEKVQDLKEKEDFLSFANGTFDELAEIPFDESEKA